MGRRPQAVLIGVIARSHVLRTTSGTSPRNIQAPIASLNLVPFRRWGHDLVDRMAHLPSMAAVAVSAVFTVVGFRLDGGQPGLVLGVLLVFGALLAAAMVRPVGLWTVVPAPPLLYAGLVVAVAALRGKSLGELAIAAAPPVARAFPQLAVAVGVGLLVAVVRLGGSWRRSRSSSTARADAVG